MEADKLNGWSVTCTVRNVSDGGARVAITNRSIVPDSFLLGISDTEPRRARLVWYSDGEAGLALTERRLRTAVTEPAAKPPVTAAGLRLEARIRAIAAGPRRRVRARFTPP